MSEERESGGGGSSAAPRARSHLLTHPPPSPTPPVATRADAITTLVSASAIAPIPAHTALASMLRTDAARDALPPPAVSSLATTAADAAEAGDDAALTAAASALAAAATKAEAHKAAAVAGGSLSRAAVAGFSSASPAAVAALASAVAAATTADDLRPVTSAAFQHGRALGADGVVVAAVSALRRLTENVDSAASSSDAAAGVATAARKVAVNDELCRGAADAGAMGVCLAALRRASPPPRLARSLFALLRQLAGSDALKASIVEGGGLTLAAAAAPGAPPALAEQALGLVAALTLRNPDAARAAVDAGCPAALAAVLTPNGATDDENADPASVRAVAYARRQACAAARNIAARAPDARPALLAAGVEPLLRAARDSHPLACGDVGEAALRDLGCVNYLRVGRVGCGGWEEAG